MDWLARIWAVWVDWLTVHVIAPPALAAGLHAPGFDAHAVAATTAIVLLQVAVIAGVFRPLEALAPAERWPDRKLTRIDQIYTLLMLFGLFPIFSYLVIEPLIASFAGGGQASDGGVGLDLRYLIPWFDGHPLALLAFYYVVYDLTYYWMHRAQHLIPWWWALHSMHHSQRQMSCWSNDRGSYLDGILQSFILASVGVAMGVDIEQYAWLTLISELMQNLSHANVRLGFGPVLERVLVDPPFHRLHHMAVDERRPDLHNCNFGQVFSVWDRLFGTALYGEPVRPTGVTDPVVDADNGRNLVAMQWHTLRRFWCAIGCREGWRPGDVGFGSDYRPFPTGPTGKPL